MKKEQARGLMIDSWVLVDGNPRQICSLTTKKAGFKRGTNGQRDFFRFDQLQGIPLSEPLLKECVTYRPTGKQQHIDHGISIRGIIATNLHHQVAILLGRFRYLHEVQSFIFSTYQLQVQFDVEKYNWLRQPEMVVTKKESGQIKKIFANILANVGPTAVIDTPLTERLKEIGSRPCDPSISGLPTLEKDERGFQSGQLTYKKKNKYRR